MLVFSRGCYIFVFKQRTAYEMRISDWSSDVCSSDLLHCAAMCGGIATSFPAMGPRGDLRYVIEPNLGRVLGYVIAGAVAGGIGEIGRASCRERVGQDV